MELHPGTADPALDGSVLQVLPENFKDTWRYSVGANYRYDEKIVLRAGVAFDQSPVNNVDRWPRLPDSDRTWLAVGGRYKYSSALNFDVGAAYIFVKDRLDQQRRGILGDPPSIAANGLVNGDYEQPRHHRVRPVELPVEVAHA